MILGDHNQSSTSDGETVTRMVSSIVRHRNFDVNSYNHDVALLRLRKSVPFNKSVRPICLPSESTYTTVYRAIMIGDEGNKNSSRKTGRQVRRKIK